MISETLRYHSIGRLIRRYLPPGGSTLDVGAKGRGIGTVYRHSFVGVDLEFPSSIHDRMKPVSASVLSLPFPPDSFDVVVCSDVLEHLPPPARPSAVRELLRVARGVLILGFPSGENARTCDLFYDELLKKQGKKRPSWLEEHLENGPVDPGQVEEVLHEFNGVEFDFFGNQSLRLSFILARIESIRILKMMSVALCRLLPSLTGAVVSRFLDRPGPYARRIYTIHAMPSGSSDG